MHIYRQTTQGRLLITTDFKKVLSYGADKRDYEAYKARLERQRKKEEAEIRKLRADADLRELELSVRRGKFIARDDVYQELAARALVLSSGIRTAFEAHALELVDAVSGDPRKVTALTQALERIFDDALSEYSRELEITVDMADMPRQEGERHVADAAD